MNKNLINILKECKNGNEDSKIKIIEKFSPIINKYNKKLNYEDAKQDLLENFLIIIEKTPRSLNADGQAVNYITKSLHNIYINLLKKEIQRNNTNLYYFDNTKLDTIKQENAKEYNLDLYNALKNLTSKEKYILIYKFYYDYKYYEIAKELGLSRKSVYRKKEQALLKLKRFLNDNEKGA